MSDSENIKESSMGFFKHVFNFEKESKVEYMNILQYSALGIVPIVLLNKAIHSFIPEVDNKKGNIEILAEVLGQIVLMFIGIIFIHRTITYIPTYSGEDYGNYNMIQIILPFFMIVLSIQSKLGEKTNILHKRIKNMVQGKSAFENFENNEKEKEPMRRQPGITREPMVNRINAPPINVQEGNTVNQNQNPMQQPQQDQQQPDIQQSNQQGVQSNMQNMDPEPFMSGGFGSAY